MLTEEQKKEIEELNECKLYFTIDGIGGFIWRIGHDISHGRYEMTSDIEEDLKNLSEAQQYALQQLSKYGIDPESAKDRENGDYWKWFNHWSNFKENMSDEEWRNFDRKMSKGEDYSDLLPKTKWNE